MQYFDWLFHAVQGDFGVSGSVYTSLPVGPSVLQRLAVTLSIIVPALVLTVIISVVLGVWSASRGGVVDRIAQGISLVGYIVPGLLLAIVPGGGLRGAAAQMASCTGFTPFAEDPGAWVRSITIPVIVLTIGGVANMAAQVRGRMIDELRRDYVRTLRTREDRRRPSIVIKHALRNAASPALTVMSLEFIQMFGGALIIEERLRPPGVRKLRFQRVAAAATSP